MPRRQWTVMIVSDDERPVRQLRLSRESIRLTIALALFAVAAISSTLTAFIVSPPSTTEITLQTRNELLKDELDGLNTRMDTLQESIDQLAQKDEFYRLLAGLEPIDGDVLLAGIGGPDANSLEARPLYRADRGAGRLAFTTGNQLNGLLRRVRVLAFSWREAEDTLTERQARFEATPSIYPTMGYVSSTFSSSRWHPILDRPRPHTGIDIVARYGTAVVSSAKGRVSAVGHQSEYGLTVEIDHGYGVMTRYAHLSRTSVKVGETVERGASIGSVGQSGLAVGPHLHYEVLVNGKAANPRRYIMDTNVVPD